MASVKIEIDDATAAFERILYATEPNEALAHAFAGLSDLLTSVLLELRIMNDANA